MKTFFVTTIFNDSKHHVENSKRFPKYVYRLTDDDYKLVNQKQYACPENEFSDYFLINQFLEEMKHERPFNLVVVDADIIMRDNYNELMVAQLEQSDFVHGFSLCAESDASELDGKSFYSEKTKGHGYCGFAYGFKHTFLEKINYQFLTHFIHGGFDYVLANMLVKDTLSGTELFWFRKELKEFFEKIRNSSYSVLETEILHVTHLRNGKNRAQRLTDFSLYI